MLIIEIALGIVLGVVALALLPALLALAIRAVPWVIVSLVGGFLLVKAFGLSWAEWKLGFEAVGSIAAVSVAMYAVPKVVDRYRARAGARREPAKPGGWRWERAMRREAKRRAALGY